MVWQNRRLPKDFFRLETQPEEGARVAEVVDAVIPGGKGFIQQLFRAKKDVLQGVSHLLQAQIHELEHIDSAIRGEYRPGVAGTAASCADSPLSPRMMTIKQMMEEASAKLRGERVAHAHGPDAACPPAHPTHGAVESPRSTEGEPGSRPGVTGPEKITLT
ncbi:hypothetical protein SAMN05443572_103234 [Myxococcus fulvus]|uniref:Uncharacterized protein n=1 Tax=Myxococcus fulvus TaxID=33 RepID=A0A511T8U4_MYXFU|nr:hypothetical protein [Myxococcus fulvus]GEN10595.1 hypothetical protein MFU01_56320 [Myxococcus fulvus]SET79069.1 hypothetical protein SAMN05443572_103234 [Myxococcus fulvus]